jgi:NAD(P)-dependent dehydrogenase (short-subunit alcohol dehydrogenase family)
MHTTDEETMTPFPRNWLVTGASRGFGRVLCELLLARGERVALTARNPAALQDLVDAHPGRALALAMDVTDDSSVSAGVAAAEKAFGIDVVVNNAGYVVVGATEEVPLEVSKAVFDTNYFGALRVIRAALPAMRARRRGHIVNISAMGGVVSSGGLGYYCATKFALEAMAEALSQELAPLGIHVTSVLPGRFRTEVQASATYVPLISDYDATSGALTRRFTTTSGQQPGDPRRAMQAIIDAVYSEAPPLRLPLGADALDRFRAKAADLLRDADRWDPIARSCDIG